MEYRNKLLEIFQLKNSWFDYLPNEISDYILYTFLGYNKQLPLSEKAIDNISNELKIKHISYINKKEQLERDYISGINILQNNIDNISHDLKSVESKKYIDLSIISNVMKNIESILIAQEKKTKYIFISLNRERGNPSIIKSGIEALTNYNLLLYNEIVKKYPFSKLKLFKHILVDFCDDNADYDYHYDEYDDDNDYYDFHKIYVRGSEHRIIYINNMDLGKIVWYDKKKKDYYTWILMIKMNHNMIIYNVLSKPVVSYGI